MQVQRLCCHAQTSCSAVFRGQPLGWCCLQGAYPVGEPWCHAATSQEQVQGPRVHCLHLPARLQGLQRPPCEQSHLPVHFQLPADIPRLCINPVSCKVTTIDEMISAQTDIWSTDSSTDRCPECTGSVLTPCACSHSPSHMLSPPSMQQYSLHAPL